MTQKTYPANVQHGDDFYLRCILIFISGLEANEPHARIAERLNAAGLQTPRGDSWNAAILKQTLKRLRNWRDYRSSFHNALLRLVYSGALTVQQTRILFVQRVSGVYL